MHNTLDLQVHQDSLKIKVRKEEVTGDLFDKCLHIILIKDAIKDGNVLGFSVEYIKTFHRWFMNNDDEIKAIDKEEVFMGDERIDLVANHIINIHNAKTKKSNIQLYLQFKVYQCL